MPDAPFVIQVPEEKPSLKEILRALPTAFRFFLSVDRTSILALTATQICNLPLAALAIIVYPGNPG